MSDSSHAAKPSELPINLIDEDTEQPRTIFDEKTLNELAATIKLRGVKTPISVRPNPAKKGRYLINHGARRYRASKIAGKKTIPAFIDSDYTHADQVIENIQRDNLTSREIADFIGRELAGGKSYGEISAQIGKSKSYISQHVTLLDLPPLISDLVNSGRIKDITVINELVKVYRKHPQEIALWLKNEDQEITRSTIKLIRECLISIEGVKKNKPDDSGTHSDGTLTSRQDLNEAPKKEVLLGRTDSLEMLFNQFYQNFRKSTNTEKIFNQLTMTERKQLGTLLNKILRLANDYRG
ncbi:MAG: ParB/RepB/Spo0J family partition protein [Nitrosomonas sp.]|nr:ParB/RepB/Spo0J family partition protein [Nitrosomonas sp.]